MKSRSKKRKTMFFERKKKLAVAALAILGVLSVAAVLNFSQEEPASTTSFGVYIVDNHLVVHGENFIVKGVCGITTPVGEDPSNPPYYKWWDDPSNYLTDFELMEAMGANTVRTYSVSGITTEALDAAHEHGLYVIMGYWVNDWQDLSDPEVRQNIIDEFVELVENHKDHPAVLMWAFGNEVDMFYPQHHPGGDLRDWYSLVQEAAQAAKAVDPNHPIICVNQGITEIGDESLGADDASLPSLDIWGVNEYRGITFGNLFSKYRSKTNKPMILTEWGCDAWDGVNGVEDQEVQAMFVESLWSEIGAHIGPAGPCLGGTVFGWSDGWWKAGSPSAHTTTSQWLNYMYPDPNINEEWWGIVAIDPSGEKTPRKAYYTLQELWKAPLNNFAVSVQPRAGKLVPGGSIEVEVSVLPIIEYSQPVNLSALDVPEGVEVSFDPGAGTPPFVSTMRITAGEDAPEGAHAITVMASSDSLTKTSVYSVLVGEPSETVYSVYDDSGTPSGTVTWTWGESGSDFSEYEDEAPEGTKCFRTVSTSWAGWGVFHDDSGGNAPYVKDISSAEALKFWVKTPVDLKFEVEAPKGWKQTKYLSFYGWDGTDTWQEMVIPATEWDNLDQVYAPFLITAEDPCTFYVDDVKWVK